MYINPDFANSVYPDVAKVTTYLKKADEVPETRDVRQLMSMLMRIAQASPRIKGHILTRKTALSAYDWKITGDEKADLMELRLKKAIASIINHHTDTPLFGNALFEIKPTYDEFLSAQILNIKRVLPVQYKALNDEKFVILDDNNNVIKQIDFAITQNEYIGETDGEVSTGGVLRSIMFHEILRNTTIQEWANLNLRLKGILLGLIDVEKFVRSATLLQSDSTKTAAEFQALEDTLKSAGENNYGVMQDSLEVKLAQIADAAAGGSFATFKKELDSDISIAILGQANTSELPSNGGSRAALQVLNMIRQDIHYSDMIRVKSLIDKLILIDYRLNIMPNAQVAPYNFEWVYEENIDVESNARVIEILVRSGVSLNVSKNDLYRITGIPKPEIDETELIELKAATNGIVL